MSESENKRRKTEQPLQAHVFTDEERTELRQSIRDSQPYKYGVIQGLVNDDLLRSARDEILSHIHFTHKETDIYKVNQTGDLANLSGLDSKELGKLSSLAKVREGLYSKEFRDLMSYVTDCGPLSGSIQDLSVNLYDKGCHLLNHDDVIGTRRVSYILYLTPPDEKWDPKWGGALRLYPTARPGVPEPDFTVVIPPAWNQLAFFRVQPGHSFHDVEEVYVDKPRLSISGWFHVPQKGEPGYSDKSDEDAAKATLAQLSGPTEDDDAYLPKRKFEPYPEPIAKAKDGEDELSKADVEYLSKYINGSILGNIPSMNEIFAENSLLELSDFLKPEYYAEVKAAIEVDDLARLPRTAAEVPQPWRLAKPPHMRRYMYMNEDSEEPASEDLAAHTRIQEIRALFQSEVFGRFLEAVTGLEPVSRYAEARRFRPGHDFTLATVSTGERPLLEATLSLTPAKWADDAGGYDLVMVADESDADPAVYRAAADDSAVLMSAMPAANALTLVLRDSDVLRFVKYVSRNAAGSRWDLNAEYEVAEDDDDDDDDDDDNETN